MTYALDQRNKRMAVIKDSMDKVFEAGMTVNKAKIIAVMGIDMGLTARKAQEYLKTLCTNYGWLDEGEEIRREAQTTLKQPDA